jgi:hypothetical protein
MNRPLLACLASALGALLLSSVPASAMCGGNIFATCPPPANAAAAEEAKIKREKRLEAIRNKKHRYPLLKR